MWRVSTILTVNGLNTAPIKFTPEVLARGTAVHAANEALAEGYTPVVEKPEYQPYVDGLGIWYAQHTPTVVDVERRIISRLYKLTGRVDFFALMEPATGSLLDPTVIDVKTGGESPWHGIQTGGYHMLACEDDALWTQFGAPYDTWGPLQRHQGLKRAILYLPGDGKPKWRPKTDAQDLYLFRSALALTRFRYEQGLLTYTDPEQPDDDVRPIVAETTVF